MAITLKLEKSDTSVSITVNIHESRKPVDFQNTAMAGVVRLEAPLDPLLPLLTYKAIESACISGLICARRKSGVFGFCVELLSYSITGNVENAEPFAVAVMLAACKKGPNSVTFFDHELNGWRETLWLDEGEN
jgi:hypothetical protein